MLRNNASFWKANFRVLRSWIAFALAIGILGGFWYGCYFSVVSYDPEASTYFWWGAVIAGSIGVVMLLFNEPIVVRLTGAYRIRSAIGREKLWFAVKKSTFRGPMPRVYVLPGKGLNAISFGWGLPFMSAVGATEGLIDSLTEDELTAVMAHEMGHVYNKDILVSTALTISVMMIAFTGWMMYRLGPFTSSNRSRSSRKKEDGGISALIVIFLIGLLMYVFGRLLGVVLQMFVSRQREYAADATSARIMGTPEPLISALNKISMNPRLGVSSVASAAVGTLCSADPDPYDLMSTHPSLYDRVEALSNLKIY
ncbi:M48 family metalloprotease [Candidatus Falkowbacteria bacterium]|jgi:heat shock protein HtpX|nr:M48 family metalloprotease [Candidatus Falkowbacteria bacterium]